MFHPKIKIDRNIWTHSMTFRIYHPNTLAIWILWLFPLRPFYSNSTNLSNFRPISYTLYNRLLCLHILKFDLLYDSLMNIPMFWNMEHNWYRVIYLWNKECIRIYYNNLSTIVYGICCVGFDGRSDLLSVYKMVGNFRSRNCYYFQYFLVLRKFRPNFIVKI